jgi:hypothetical protein
VVHSLEPRRGGEERGRALCGNLSLLHPGPLAVDHVVAGGVAAPAVLERTARQTKMYWKVAATALRWAAPATGVIQSHRIGSRGRVLCRLPFALLGVELKSCGAVDAHRNNARNAARSDKDTDRLTGQRPTKEPRWKYYPDHLARRNGVAHGSSVAGADVEKSLAAVDACRAWLKALWAGRLG